jgi:16S rRNA (guanine527-N7)-methyltransferase
MSGDADLLVEGLGRLHLPFGPEHLGKLRIFLEELKRWNRSYGFVGGGSGATERELIVRHVLDCLAAWENISALARREVADVGSGAGFPGIPLAVFLPEARFTLVEPTAKKSAFLRNVAILAGLPNVRVAEARLEQLEQRFDLVVFRAFSPLHRSLDALQRILLPGGVIVAYKGKRARILEELKASGLDSRQVEILAVRVPFLNEERHLVVVSKASSES